MLTRSGLVPTSHGSPGPLLHCVTSQCPLPRVPWHITGFWNINFLNHNPIIRTAIPQKKIQMGSGSLFL